MTEWTTIRVKQDAKDAAEERKPEGMTWSEFIALEKYDPEVLTPEIDYTEIATRTANEVEERLR